MKTLKHFFYWFFSSRLKRWIFLYLPLLFVSMIFLSDHIVEAAAEGKMYERAEDVPACNVALVLGTSPKVNGSVNLFYIYRMRAAADLWKAGKVKHFIVSGDNSTMTYDETTAMKTTLVDLGVPDSVITLDYAGFHTLDSVVRCKWVFGQTDIVIISQEFHNARALFIAEHFGIHAVALNARDVPGRYPFRVNVREYFSRLKAVLDIFIFHSTPHFSGPPEPIKL